MSSPTAAQKEATVFPSPDALLAAIVESSEDAIVSKNLRSIVTSWNSGAERVFGYTAEEMIGTSITRLIPHERLQEEDTILSKIQAGERVEHYETVRVRKDGRRIDVSLTISPVRDASGAIVGASKIARDVTDQKRAAEELTRAHDQLKQADRVKSDFISTLSHELRTPLTAMMGWVQLLKEGATPSEREQGLEVIERNIRVQSQLVNDLLDMSRIESGKMTLDLQPIDLPELMDAALAAIRPTATVKFITITESYADAHGIVKGDRNRLQQVFWNLLSNAIKFTPRGGRIHVTVQRVESYAEVSIRDTGMGIDPQSIGAIFERFSQADSSITRRHGGLGLGLAIVKHLTELHGGTVRAESLGEGQGAQFTVRLPLVPLREDNAGTSRDGPSSTNAGSDLGGVKVLVVEDDPDSSATLVTILRRRGAEVRGAASMDEALAAFREFHPDVLLSDIGMPVHDGYELIGRVRSMPEGQTVPAVALTALARSEDRNRALNAGFQMHVAKPVEAKELVAVVRNLAALSPSRRFPKKSGRA